MRNIFRKSRDKGLTMIELLLYMGLFSIMLVSLMQLFTSILDVKLESEATSAVSQDGRYIIAKLSSDIHQASNIVDPVLGSGPTLHLTGSINYTYQLNGENLVLVNNNTSTTDQLNSADTTIPQITFTKISNSGAKDTVLINFTLKSKVVRSGGNNQTQVFQTTVGLR